MWSPNGKLVSFTQDHDLYLADLTSGQVQRLTNDGSEAICNRCLDWVYNEELPLTSALGFHSASMSADGQYLVEQFSSLDTPPTFFILKMDGSLYSALGRRDDPSLTLPRVQRDFIKVKAHDGTELYAQLIYPEFLRPLREGALEDRRV